MEKQALVILLSRVSLGLAFLMIITFQPGNYIIAGISLPLVGCWTSFIFFIILGVWAYKLRKEKGGSKLSFFKAFLISSPWNISMETEEIEPAKTSINKEKESAGIVSKESGMVLNLRPVDPVIDGQNVDDRDTSARDGSPRHRVVSRSRIGSQGSAIEESAEDKEDENGYEDDTVETLIEKLLERRVKRVVMRTYSKTEFWYDVNLSAKQVLIRKGVDNLEIIIKEWMKGAYDGIGAQFEEDSYLVGYQSGDTSDKDYYEKEKRPFLKVELLKILQAQPHTTVGSKLEEMELYDDAMEWYKINKMGKEESELKKKLRQIEESVGSVSDRLKKGDNQFKNFWGDKLILLDDRVELILTEKSPSLKGKSADRYDIGKTRIHYDGLKMGFSKKHKWIEFGQNNSWGEGIIHFKNLAKWQRIEEMIYEAKKNYGKNPIQQTIIHGDYVDDRDTTYIDDRDTTIKDSVLNRSNVGSGGKSKSEELREAKALLDDGIIDDAEFQQMKKEILGK